MEKREIPTGSVRRRRRLVATIAAVITAMSTLTMLPLVAGAQVPPQECFVVADSTNSLGRVDLTSLTETLIGPTGVPDIEDITFGEGQVLYAADADDFGTIDLLTGQYTSIGPVGSGTADGVTLNMTDVDSLTWDPTLGVMWGSSLVNGPDPLFQIDITTGALIPGVFGGNDYVLIQGPYEIVDDISVEPSTGVMFASMKTPPNDQLITIDKTSGAITVLPELTGVGDVEGLAFDEIGQLLGTTGAIGSDPNSLYMFDTTTGVGTKLMDLGVTGGDYEGVDCRTITDPAIIDLELEKSVDNPTPELGATVTFSQTLTNQGPDDATGVVVNDVLPAGVTYVSDDSAGAYDPATGDWTVGDLTAGATVSLSIAVTVDVEGTITNVTQVSAANETDIDSTPNNDDGDQSEDDESAATITVSTDPLIDLELIKTVDESNPSIGDTVRFSITVTNQGPSDATGVGISDALPPGLTNVTAVSDGGTVSGTTIAWSGFDIPVGESITVTFDVIVEASTEQDAYFNVAQVSDADQQDVDSTPGNEDGTPYEDDEDPEPVTVSASVARLEGTVWHDDDRDGVIDDGETRFGNVSVGLIGPGPDTTLGTGDDVEVATTVTAGDGTYGFDAAPGDYIVRIDGTDIPSGFEQVYDLDAALDGQTAVILPDNTVVTDIDFGYDDQDVDAFNLVLTKTAGTATKGANGVWSVSWTITILNEGPGSAAGPVTMTDRLPEQLTFVDITEPDGWSCDEASSIVTCTHADAFTAGETASFTLLTTIDADPGEIVVNPAEVSSSDDEEDLDDNEDDDTTAIEHAPTGTDADRLTLWALWMIVLGGVLLVIGGSQPAPRARAV